MKILILNGPPGSGKDAIAQRLDLPVFKMADHLRNIVMAWCDLPNTNIVYERSKSMKVAPGGKTLREFMIWVSETLVKPHLGEHYFSDYLCKQILDHTQTTSHKLNQDVVIVDVGFDEEVETLCEQFGSDNLVLCRVFRDGCTFDNDSRDYIHPVGGMEHFWVHNEEGELDLTVRKVRHQLDAVSLYGMPLEIEHA